MKIFYPSPDLVEELTITVYKNLLETGDRPIEMKDKAIRTNSRIYKNCVSEVLKILENKGHDIDGKYVERKGATK